MAIEGFSPPSPSPSPPSPYYQLLERGSARLGRVKKRATRLQLCKINVLSLVNKHYETRGNLRGHDIP